MALSFPQAEWDLIVRLPGRVLIAATVIERDSVRHTVAESLAGIEAIAAGRASPSRLLRDVVAAIYAEQAGDTDPGEFADPRSGVASVLADCRVAARTLERRASAADAAAYRDWLTDIAVTVCSVARVEGRMTAAERRFLVDLSLALTV
ncbi:hypothetical protein HC028_03555 [Planosporangium flavigriseum]|uniref:Uncharacterized protein n=1 Tax=Planosporangium flavigriseum TaxID=373681 RepID=A0A8J3LKM6_9ACTN|nr:hypothetical protein [Planosporangium flavigriseum]NJC63589.1 hypothetical protein [Planosporangium flavigriseum]GIG72290.1 hypothetical protein Pfl04_06940 [Planosporangium flavigriseum]